MKNTLIIAADFINEIVHEEGAFGAYHAQSIKHGKC